MPNSLGTAMGAKCHIGYLHILALWSRLSASGAHATLPIVATILSMAILLWVGSHPTQILFYVALERMTAKYP